MPYAKKLLAAIGGIVASLPNRVSISGHTSGNDAPGGQLGLVIQPRQPGPRPVADRRPGRTDRIYEVAGKPGRSRFCRKTPRQRQPQAFHPVDARGPAGSRPYRAELTPGKTAGSRESRHALRTPRSQLGNFPPTCAPCAQRVVTKSKKPVRGRIIHFLWRARGIPGRSISRGAA